MQFNKGFVEEIEVDILQGEGPHSIGYHIHKLSGKPLTAQEILDTISDVLLQQFGEEYVSPSRKDS